MKNRIKIFVRVLASITTFYFLFLIFLLFYSFIVFAFCFWYRLRQFFAFCVDYRYRFVFVIKQHRLTTLVLTLLLKASNYIVPILKLKKRKVIKIIILTIIIIILFSVKQVIKKIFVWNQQPFSHQLWCQHLSHSIHFLVPILFSIFLWLLLSLLNLSKLTINQNQIFQSLIILAVLRKACYQFAKLWDIFWDDMHFGRNSEIF